LIVDYKEGNFVSLILEKHHQALQNVISEKQKIIENYKTASQEYEFNIKELSLHNAMLRNRIESIHEEAFRKYKTLCNIFNSVRNRDMQRIYFSLWNNIIRLYFIYLCIFDDIFIHIFIIKNKYKEGIKI
jgi:hypothetical protein